MASKREWIAKTITKAEKRNIVKKDDVSMIKSKAGRPKKAPSPEKMLKDILPVENIFEEDELKMYRELVNVYMADFDSEDLTSSDMDDILDLAKNRVLEFRLLRETKGNPEKQLDMAQTIERLSKKNEKIKESLSFRRKDRINPNEFKGFSIVDLAVAFDQSKKLKLQEKVVRLKDEEKVMLEKRKNYSGNKNDLDLTEGNESSD
ncbi:hypothetical protein KAW18_03590 [candidate division WOR-3 bacterium]|nr:hypothetical protein [candidate division WOR-3 bacterium]